MGHFGTRRQTTWMKQDESCSHGHSCLAVPAIMEGRLFLENVSKGGAVGWGGRKRKDAERGKFSRFLPSSLLPAPPIGQVPQSHCQDSWNSRCVGEGAGGTDLEAKGWPLEQGGNSPGKEPGTQDRQHASAKGEPSWILSEETKDAHSWEPRGEGSGARRYQRSGQGHRQQVKQSKQRFYSRTDGKPLGEFQGKKSKQTESNLHFKKTI